MLYNNEQNGDCLFYKSLCIPSRGRIKGKTGIRIQCISEKRDTTSKKYAHNCYINLWSKYRKALDTYIVHLITFTSGIEFVKFYSLFKSIWYFNMLLSIVNQVLQVVNTKKEAI